MMPSPIRLADDEPRARLSDPIESHLAADAGQDTISALRMAVLRLVAQEQPCVGSEVNDLYQLRTHRHDWPVCAWDSPRKRLSWLLANGYIEVVGSRPGVNNRFEREFAVTWDGRELLGLNS